MTTRRRTFAAVAIITLGLGIGAATAIYSVVDAVLLRPLPFKDTGRIAAVWVTTDWHLRGRLTPPQPRAHPLSMYASRRPDRS